MYIEVEKQDVVQVGTENDQVDPVIIIILFWENAFRVVKKHQRFRQLPS